MKKNYVFVLLFVMCLFTMYGQNLNENEINITYKIGDTGPAGGIIFYDKGFISDGWRYLEAAPPNTEFTATFGGDELNSILLPKLALIGIVNLKIDRDRLMIAVGTGKENTRRIDLGGSAALMCAQLSINGFYDWFLPSKDELVLMFNNLKVNGLGGFSNRNYWSSSYSKLTQYWSINFSNGREQGISLELILQVRAIRSF